MPPYHLYSLNKAYSSWSMRPWMVLKAFDLPFEDTVIFMDDADYKERILAVSPTGKVPLLVDGSVHVWDSLAIAEYLADMHPDKALWPRDREARAYARSACAEMHSGFGPLREHLGMMVRRRFTFRVYPTAVLQDIHRVQTLWAECRRRFGNGGPFLFGEFSIADAFYAPIITRFRTYNVPLSDEARRYCEAVEAHPAFRQWIADSEAETVFIAKYEAGAPADAPDINWTWNDLCRAIGK